MNDTLKAAGRIGAELGAAKAENERLRGLLRTAWRLRPDHDYHESHLQAEQKAWEVEVAAVLNAADALAQQAEPTDTFTAVDMATAAAQGFRDGQAAVEQAAAQDERKTFEVEIPDISAIYDGRSFIPYRSLEAGERLMTVAQHLRIEKQLRAALTRPAQAEQQPVAVPESWWQLIHDTLRNYRMGTLDDGFGDGYPLIDAMTADGQPVSGGIQECTYLADEIWNALRVAPIAQTAPQPEQSGLADLPYQTLFDAIAAATDAGDAPISISVKAFRAALSAQGAGKFAMHQRVRKTSGSEWQGRICGTYSTALTPEGYAVESEAHAGSVQIYPATALEAVE